MLAAVVFQLGASAVSILSAVELCFDFSSVRPIFHNGSAKILFHSFFFEAVAGFLRAT